MESVAVASMTNLLLSIATGAWHGPSLRQLLNNACASLNQKQPHIHATDTGHYCILHHLGVKLSLAARLSRELTADQSIELTALLALLHLKGICTFKSSDICTISPYSVSSGPSSSGQPIAPPLSGPSSLRMIRGLGLIHEEQEEEESSAAVADEVEGLGFRALGLKELPSDHHNSEAEYRTPRKELRGAGDGEVSKRIELMRRLERKRAKLEMKLAEIDAMKRSVMEGQVVPISGSKRARVARTGQDRLSEERSNSVNSLHYTKSARVAHGAGVRRDPPFASPSDSEEDGSESSSLSSDPYDSGSGGEPGMMDPGAAPSSSHVQGSNNHHPVSPPAAPSSHSPVNLPRHSFDPAYPSLPLSLDDDPEPNPRIPAAGSQVFAAGSQSKTSSSVIAQSSQGGGRGRGDDKSKVQELKETFDRLHWNQPVYTFSRTSSSTFVCELTLPLLPPQFLQGQDQPPVIKSAPQLTKKAAKEEVAELTLKQLLKSS